MFVFDDMGYNFEPSEIGAAFGLQQLEKLDRFTQVRRHNFDHYTDFFNQRLDRFVPARQTDGVETAWLCYPVLVRPDAGSVALGGRLIGELAPRERNLSLLFQNVALFPTMTGYENLAFPLKSKLRKFTAQQIVRKG